MDDDYYNTNIEGRFFVSEKNNIYDVVLKSNSY